MKTRLGRSEQGDNQFMGGGGTSMGGMSSINISRYNRRTDKQVRCIESAFQKTE